jgi:hypothetical protein
MVRRTREIIYLSKFECWCCSGVVSTLAGTGVAGFADGGLEVAKFNGPFGVSFGSSANIILVADCSNNRIRTVSFGEIVCIFEEVYIIFYSEL